MNVRIFWVRAMKCMYAQTRPRFILSCEGVFGGMEFEPMLTPREKSPLPKMSPVEDRTRDAVDSEPKHYQLSYSGPPPLWSETLNFRKGLALTLTDCRIKIKFFSSKLKELIVGSWPEWCISSMICSRDSGRKSSPCNTLLPTAKTPCSKWHFLMLDIRVLQFPGGENSCLTYCTYSPVTYCTYSPITYL